MKNALCTLDDVIEQLDLPDAAAVNSATIPTSARSQVEADINNKKPFLKKLIFDVSAEIEREMGRRFVPYVKKKFFDREDVYEKETWYEKDTDIHVPVSDRLFVNEDLLFLVEVINGNGEALANSDFRLYPRNSRPHQEIRIRDDVSESWEFDYLDSEIEVTGVWGYHEDPDNMWASASTLTANINAAQTTITVADSSLYAELQYINAGDEYMFITAIDNDTDTLTVQRGVNGTTAVSHTSGSAVDTYEQTPDVRKECRRLVIVHHNMRSELGDVTVVGDTAINIADRGINLKRNRSRLIAE